MVAQSRISPSRVNVPGSWRSKNSRSVMPGSRCTLVQPMSPASQVHGGRRAFDVQRVDAELLVGGLALGEVDAHDLLVVQAVRGGRHAGPAGDVGPPLAGYRGRRGDRARLGCVRADRAAVPV